MILEMRRDKYSYEEIAHQIGVGRSTVYEIKKKLYAKIAAQLLNLT